jgi:hypothetical protein
MQEERDHKGLFGMVRSFIIEDAPEDEHAAAEQPLVAHEPHARPAARDGVDAMFSEIEAQVAGKPAAPAAKGAGAGQAAPTVTTAAPSSGTLPTDILPADVQKVIKLIEALPAVLTPEQVRPLLQATMDAANLNSQTVALQVSDSTKRAEDAIAAAQNEIARLESEREETLGRLTRLMEAARSQCADGVAAQGARIADLTAALSTLGRVSTFMEGTGAPDGTEKKL